MAKIIHNMIRVIDLETSQFFYEQAFGLKATYELDFESYKLVYLRNEETDMEIELTFNKG